LALGAPDVVFHSLRHSSTTYKLKLTGGDIKATQGDTGHAQVEMVTKVYSHILDEDRKINAQKFDEAFYRQKKEPQGLDAKQIVELISGDPALANEIRGLLIK
jgi:site-specific recombinase XerC